MKYTNHNNFKSICFSENFMVKSMQKFHFPAYQERKTNY